jgi:hypothetical protein
VPFVRHKLIDHRENMQYIEKQFGNATPMMKRNVHSQSIGKAGR